jgi:imidazolonepropionase-like amidohydrolase
VIVSNRGRLGACPTVFFSSLLILVFLPGCKPPETASVRAIVGAVLVDGTGGPPISNSVVLISGSRVARAGARTGIVIPPGAEEIDGSGKFVIPGIVNLYGAKAGGLVTTLARTATLGAAATAEEARGVRGVSAIILDAAAPAVEEAALEHGRKESLPVLARISTLADARRLVAAGAAGFIGMIRDTEGIEPGFIARMRDLRTVWAPVLSEVSGPALEVAKRNTKKLADGGVPIAAGSGAAPVLRELELLQEAGMQPGDVVLAATRNGAMALGQSREVGTIQAGRRADLVLVTGNPLEDVRNLKTAVRAMVSGSWTP